MKVEVYCDCCKKYKKAKNIRINGIPLSKEANQSMDKPATISMDFILSCNHFAHIYLKGETCITNPQ